MGPWLTATTRPVGGGAPSERAAAGGSTAATAAQPHGPGRIDVTLRRADGTPVEGDLVEVFAPEGGASPAPIRTNVNGEAHFTDLPALDGYSVRVSELGGRRGAFSASRTVDVSASVVAAVPFGIRASRLAGHVIDAESKAPVANAVVRAVRMVVFDHDDDGPFRSYGLSRSNPPQVAATGTSDADGRFVLTGDWEEVEVEATAPDGRRGSSLDWPRGEGAPCVIPVAPRSAVPLRGVVVDERGRPVADVEVSTRRPDSPAGSGPATRTDREGRFTLGEPDGWFVSLALRLADGSSFDAAVPLGTDPLVRIVVPLTTALRVTILDEVTDEPVPGVEVSLVRDGPLPSGAWGADARGVVTDAAGKARIPAVPGSVSYYSFRIGKRSVAFLHASEVEDEHVAVVPGSDLGSPYAVGEERDVLVHWRQGSVVTGRVVFEDGTPAVGARVRTSAGTFHRGQGSATAGEDGRFRLQGVVPPQAGPVEGPLGVRASLAGYASASLTLATVEPSGLPATQDVGDLVLRRFGVVRGRVVDADSKPVAGATLFVERAPADDGSTTDEEGKFTVVVGERIASGGTVALLVKAEGFQALRLPLPHLPPPGGILDVPTIVLDRSASLKVRVLDPQGRPARGVRVLAQNSISGSEVQTAPRTDGDGCVALERVGPDGHFALWTEDGSEYSYWTDGRREGGGAVTIRLPATRRLEGRVVDESGTPIPYARFVLDESGTTRRKDSEAEFDPFVRGSDAAGAFHLPAAPAVEFRLKVSANGFVTGLVNVPVGAPPHLDLSLERFTEAHRKRLAELQEKIRVLRAELEKRSKDVWDDQNSRLFDMEEEVRRLAGD